MVNDRSIELNIQRLSLHGFSARDARRIGRAVETELMRLLTQKGIPPHFSTGGTVRRMKGGALRLSKPQRAEAVGNQIARSIYQGGRGK